MYTRDHLRLPENIMTAEKETRKKKIKDAVVHLAVCGKPGREQSSQANGDQMPFFFLVTQQFSSQQQPLRWQAVMARQDL